MAFLEFDGALDEAPAGDNAPGFKPFDGKLDTRRGGTRAEGKPFVAGMEAPVTPTPSQPAAAEVPNNYAERGVGGVLADIRTSADMRGARMAPPVPVLERPATPEMLAAQPPGLTAQEMAEGSIAPWKLDQMRAAGEYVAPTRPAEAKPFSTAQNIAQDVREATTNPVARGAVAGFSNLGQTGVGLVRGAADMVGADEVSRFATDTSRTANTIGAGATQGLSGNNKLIADVTASIISSTPAMAIGTIGGPALRTLFAQTAAADYAETGDAAHAGIVGAAEALGERFGFPEQIKLLKGVVRGMPAGDVAKVFGAMIAKEIPGEQLTTALEFLGDKYGPGARTPGATFADYLQQAGDTLAVTIGQTAAMGGGPATVVQTRNAMGQADAAVNRSAMSMPERAAADKGFVRPTQQRKAIDESLDDFAATHGATPTAQKALEAMKAEGAKRPLSQVADYYRRAVAALSRRGLVNWPADDRSLEGIGKPPVKESGQSGSHETTEAGPAPDIADRLAGQLGLADEEPSNAQPDLAASPPVAAGAGAAGAPDADAGGGTVGSVAPDATGQGDGRTAAPELGDRGPVAAEGGDAADQALTPRTSADLAGESINRNWRAFTPESGTLNLPREQLPQIKAEHRGALVQFLGARGITHETDAEVDPRTLKPTQGEFSPAKVQQAREFVGGDRSILVSSDGYVLDGHHQWLAKLDTGEPVKAIRLNAPIQDLLRLAHQFPSSTTARGATRPAVQSAAAPAEPAPGLAVEGGQQPGAAALIAEQPRVIARAGRTPNSAEPIELRANPDGTLTPYMGGKAMLDFESGEPVVVPAGASDLDAKKAIREAGSVSNRTNFYPAEKAPKAEAQPPALPSQPPAQAPADAPQPQPEKAEKPATDKESLTVPMPAVLGIPREAAQAAHAGTSFVPEQRAMQEQDGFMSALRDAWTRAARIAGTDEKAIERITEVFKDVADGYRQRYLATLGARSRVMSSMIAGPARFPVERNRKRLETERKRAEEASEYLQRGIKRLIRAARGPIDNPPESELERVRLNLSQREEQQEMMKAANVALRKGDDAALEDLGFTAEQIADLKKPDFAGRKGFPDYKLTNNNAEIRRLRERLKDAESRMEAAAAGPAEREVAGVRVVEDATADRIRLYFDGKPSEEVLDTLKSNGFRWSPKEGAWQRQLTDNARRAADDVLAKMPPGDLNLSAAEPTPPFYSELSRQVERVNMNAGPAASWKAWLRGLPQKGVKPDEIAWTGLEEWLDLVASRPSAMDRYPASQKDLADAASAYSKTLADLGATEAAGVKPDGRVEVPSDGAPALDPVLAQRMAVDADSRSNLRDLGAGRVQSLGQLNVPTQRAVVDAVRVALHDGKILRSVVELVPVDVMNNLVGKQISPKALLDNPSVLQRAFALDRSAPIPGPVDVAVSALLRAPTFDVAEVLRMSLQSGSRLLASGAAVRASEIGHVASLNAPIQAIKVTKQAVLDYLNANGVKVTETVLGGDGGLPLFQADNPAGWSSIDGGGSEADTARYAADPDRNHLRIVDFARESIAERRPGFMLRAVEAPGSRSDLRAARAVARGIAGHRVVFVRQDGDRVFNGAAFGSPGHNYLLIDVDSTQPVMAVAGHEVLHRLRAARPDLYDKLNARISAVLRNEGAYADRLRTKYAGLNLKPLSDEKIHEELLADVFGDEWSDPEFWRELGRDRPQGLRALAESVAKFLDDLVSKIIRLRPFGTEQYLTDLRAAREAVLDATREFQKGEVGDGGGMGDIAFSVDNHTPEQRDALARAGIRGKESIRDRIGAAFSKVADAIKTRGDLSHTFVQGSLDQFHGIRQAIKAELGNLPAEQDPYITARLANGGTSSVMRALLLHGRAQWSDNGQNLVKMDGTKGLLDTLAPLGADLNDFFGWMIGNRAARLKKEGRENNFTDDQIKALQGLSKGKEREFTKAALEYGAFKKALLDMAQSAGIVNAESRKAWDHADYIPFYRQIDEKSVFSPTGRKGLAGQSSGIRVLKGGESALNDPIENLLMNMSRLVDASLKNNAMLKTVDALKSSDVLTKVGYDMAGAVIPTSQVKKMLTAAGTPEAVLDAIPSEAFEGMAKMWAIQAPSDPDVVRVMRDGKPEFYRVNDPLLLKAMTSFVPFDFPGLGIARAFKRVLTATVTATPEFMARNFIRDSLAAHAIGRDGFNPAASIAGIAKSYTESGAGEDMLFAGASFQSGNISAADPTGTAVAVRRALRARGMDAASANRFIGTVLDTPAKLWEAYRHVGEAIENANREAIYEAAIKSGKSPTEAAYEAKDLMDFSLRGSSPAYQLLADVLPFFNARVQGLYRLGRADPKRLAVYGLLLTAASVALALANGDADWYDELPDWDKDTYWHFKIAGKHFRVPKPFELGVAFATIPERIMRYIKKQDAGSKTLGRLWANVRDQLAMDPVPQAIRPALNAWANKDTFRDQPIEGQADQGKLPSMRYSSQTSSAAKAAVGAAAPAADAIGLSPKKLEYLIGGYLGTAGLYALGLMDLAVDKIQGKPPGPTKRPDDIPLVRTFYRADPARATVYESDLYKMREEVEQVFKSIHALRGPNSTDADEAKAQSMEDENADKLGMRKTILNATKHLQSANKDRDAIMADTIMTPDEKRKALDDLQREKNQIAKEAVKDVQAAF